MQRSLKSSRAQLKVDLYFSKDTGLIAGCGYCFCVNVNAGCRPVVSAVAYRPVGGGNAL